MQDRVLRSLYNHYYHTVHAERARDGSILHVSGFGRLVPDPHLVESYRVAIEGGFEAFKARVASEVRPKKTRPEQGE